MKFFYYPGCSLEATAKEYDHSVRSVCQNLGIELVESEDWCCCGSSAAHSLNKLLSIALPAHNIALAQKAGADIVAPCSACFNRLKRADKVLREDGEIRQRVEETVEFKYTGTINVYSLLEALVSIYGLDKIAARVKKPLNGMKVVCYYGCMLVRPPEVTNFDRPENPQSMDNLMKKLGAEVKMWSYKTECCGAHQGVVNEKLTTRLVGNLLEMAMEAGAQALVTSCPLCQANIEMRRNQVQDLPSFYFTELIEIALGVPVEKIWFKKHLVNPLPLLQSLNLAS
ncbi:CoB--CoM heterodisulfide reductase iron-sulfur subunit B family protein [Desulfofundulus sp.]|uniref:CoB--CoM heterodisulfide reductase iron-sulfur subunit B family protein n=1 Tax=Desulfofundulus sp. TaxID=2282750 RepID=UPI003C73CD8C